MIDIGVVGINLEDALASPGPSPTLRDVNEQVERILKAKEVASARNVPDFVINARTDALVHGHSLAEAISRGRAYLQAGATTVFVWGGSQRGGVAASEVLELSRAFGGKLAVQWAYEREGALDYKGIAELNVARISIGPRLWRDGMREVEAQMNRLLKESE